MFFLFRKIQGRLPESVSHYICILIDFIKVKHCIYIKYLFFFFLSSQGKILMPPGLKSRELSLRTKNVLGFSILTHKGLLELTDGFSIFFLYCSLELGYTRLLGLHLLLFHLTEYSKTEFFFSFLCL